MRRNLRRERTTDIIDRNPELLSEAVTAPLGNTRKPWVFAEKT
jgi:hypothetical protein